MYIHTLHCRHFWCVTTSFSQEKEVGVEEEKYKQPKSILREGKSADLATSEKKYACVTAVGTIR